MLQLAGHYEQVARQTRTFAGLLMVADDSPK
jgi:hypothetical protein